MLLIIPETHRTHSKTILNRNKNLIICLNIHIHMASKTLTIREEAYLALKALQLEKESFSETILRLSKYFSNLKESWGTGTRTSTEYDQELKQLEKNRESFFAERE